LDNKQGYFQLHRFTRRENTAKSFRGATFFDSHCTHAVGDENSSLSQSQHASTLNNSGDVPLYQRRKYAMKAVQF